MLNTGKRLWLVDEQRQYFASHAATDKQVLIGIFPKDLTNSPLGILILKPDLQTGVFVISVLIGSKSNRGGNTVAQSTFPVVDRLFNEYGFAKGKCHVRPQNKAVQWLLLQGPWRREARLKGELLDAATGKRTDLLVFGVLKEDWLDFHARRPARQNG
jgi:hypothetical protein